MADGVEPVAPGPEPVAAGPGGPRTGALGRLGLLAFGLLFQILTFLALFIALHILRGHYQDSTYTTAQEIVAAVLGLPGAAIAIGVLAAAIYTLFSGRRAGLVFRLALTAAVVLAVAYGLELALK